jgi:hypothetical protein
MFTEKKLLKRIYAKVETDKNKLCFKYTGATNGKQYGRIWARGKNHSVHRLMYQIFFGDIPADKEVHHTCGIRNCCNPAHLELISHRENVAQIGRYEQLRWQRLQDLLAINFELTFFGITQVTSSDLSLVWGKNFKGSNLNDYLETLQYIFEGDFECRLVREGRGSRPHLYEIRMTPELVKRVELYEDNTSQPNSLAALAED